MWSVNLDFRVSVVEVFERGTNGGPFKNLWVDVRISYVKRQSSSAIIRQRPCVTMWLGHLSPVAARKGIAVNLSARSGEVCALFPVVD